MKKKIIYIVLFFCTCCIILFSIIENCCTEKTKSYNITFIRMKEGGQFWSSMRNGVREARTDTHSVVDFYSTVKVSDVSKQIDYIQKAIEKKADCIVITPCSYFLLKKPLELAEKKGIKIISLYNEYDKSSESSSIFYMTDLRPAGCAVAAKIIQNKNINSVNAMVVGSFDTISSEKYLAEGFREKLISNPLNKCQVLYAGRDIDSICNQILNSYAQNKKINLIFALNDETSQGLIKALKRIHENSKIIAVVSSNSLMNIEGLETGTIDDILVINSFAMGYQSIYAALNSIKGRKIHQIPVDFTIVTRKNMFDSDIQKKLFPLP